MDTGKDITLYCGDCLDFIKTLPDECVDAVVTDPPFGIGFQYTNGREMTNNSADYWEWLGPIYRECLRCLKPGGFTAIWNAHKNFRHFWEWFGDDIVIYVAAKNFVQLRNSPFQLNGYDPVIMRYLPGGKPLRPTNPKRNINFFVANTAGIVSDTKRLERSHPCPRPLDAVTEILDNFVLPNGIVLDCFMGSGTTGVAAVNTHRSFIGCEIEQSYFKLAQNRIQQSVEAKYGHC